MTLDSSIRNVYFIGVGGIGMSALARFMAHQGLNIAGYDKTATALTDQLISEGIQISFDEEDSLLQRWHATSDETNSLLVVRTPAVPESHPAITFARSRNIPIIKRSELLGKIARDFRTLAIAGTHGKTTTSAMLAHMLSGENGGCQAFLGGTLAHEKTNVLWSEDSPWAVIEADEFDRSFLHLTPEFAVITSVDPDHLDVYGDANSVVLGFEQFARQTQKKLLLEKSVSGIGIEALRYGIVDSDEESEQLTYGLHRLHMENGWLVGDLKAGNQSWENIRFPIPGIHNVKNAVAALAMAHLAGMDMKKAIERLGNFKGIQRRFAYHIRTERGTYIDDYAHHPAEIQAACDAARLHHPNREISVIFQPHLFSRTRDHLHDFARVLGLFDRVFILPIYPAREKPIPGIDSQLLFENIPNPRKHLITSNRIFDNLKEHPPEVLMTLGAGDIDRCVEPLAHWLNEDPRRFKTST